ncbi:MAG: LysR family transcriptional regulator [Roseibium sp.]|nr:LysR family transcriptional regulator [Roseibium sp.]
MDIKQGDIGLLLALDALLEHENVSRAAAQLGVSQPAMSAQLKRLRHLFNDPLLTPSGRRLVATSRARALQDDLRRHLRDLDALVRENSAFEPDVTRKTFRIVATDYVHALLAPRVEDLIGHAAPHARLSFLSFEPRSLWTSLEEDAVDLALVSGMALPEARSRPAFTEDFRVIMRHGHPFADAELSLEQFCLARHVLVSPEGGGFVGAADKVLAGLGLKRRVAVSLPSFLLAPALVARTDNLCLVPGRLVPLFADSVTSCPTPFDSPVFDVDLMWHPRRQNDPSHVWLRQQLADFLRHL